MSEASFAKTLASLFGLELDLILNENRSQLISFMPMNSKKARLSIHRMFLDAPPQVLHAVVRYLRRKSKAAYKVMQQFIAQQSPLHEKTYPLSIKDLSPQGNVYDLQGMYEEINATYFEGAVDAKITWYGKHTPSSVGKTLTFGKYLEHFKLIKIHRMLDSVAFPEYFVASIVYHEMLHQVIPPYLDAKGIWRRHGAEFKMRERQFQHYRQAAQWLKTHKEKLFQRKFYGRA